MGKTSYISSNGMLIGEETNGVMRNYGTDALGSVVETVLNGVEENTYVYKPYGATLAKTGTAADPSFLWNGGSGYRATALASSNFYVRRRHLSDSSASWTTVDPLWPGEHSYSYVSGRPASSADPSGLQCRVGGPKSGPCAAFNKTPCCESTLTGTASCGSAGTFGIVSISSNVALPPNSRRNFDPTIQGPPPYKCSDQRPWNNRQLYCTATYQFTESWTFYMSIGGWFFLPTKQWNNSPTCGGMSITSVCGSGALSCDNVYLQWLSQEIISSVQNLSGVTCNLSMQIAITAYCANPPDYSYTGGGE